MSVIRVGTGITSPVLIYQDEVPEEISSNPRSQSLFCESSGTGVSWHFPSGSSVDQFSFPSSEDFLQLIRPMDTQLLRNSMSALTNTSLNGLWSCRLNGDESGAIPVGIYSRGGGKRV